LAAGGAVHKGDAAAGVVVEKHLADCVSATIANGIKGGCAFDGFGLGFAGEALFGGGDAAVAQSQVEG